MGCITNNGQGKSLLDLLEEGVIKDIIETKIKGICQWVAWMEG